MEEFVLYNSHLEIKPFKTKFITKKFINFLNDKKVNQFLTTKKKKQSLPSAKSYYLKMKKEKNLYHGIFDRKKNKIIGTITLRKKNFKTSYVGIMIGDRKYQGTKYTSNALNVYLDHAFRLLGFKFVEAGVHKHNLSSAFFFHMNGFKFNKKERNILFLTLSQKKFIKNISYKFKPESQK